MDDRPRVGGGVWKQLDSCLSPANILPPVCKISQEGLTSPRGQRTDKLSMIPVTKSLSALCEFYSNDTIRLKCKAVASPGETLKEALTGSVWQLNLMPLSICMVN